MLDGTPGDQCGKDILTDVLAVGKHLLNLVANFTVGKLDVVLSVSGIVHKGEEAVIGNIEL